MTFILDRFILKQIAYQAVSTSLTRVLKDNRKSLWLSFPIQIGPYKLKNVEYAGKEFHTLKLI